jgi:hypothetical protein
MNVVVAAAACKGCGYTHAGECRYKDTRYYNHGGFSWAESRQAKDCFKSKVSAVRTAGKDDAYIAKMNKTTRIPGKPEAQEKGFARQGTSLSLMQNMQLRERPLPDYLREGRLHLTTLFSRPVTILFDSGAVQSNFVSKVLAEWIRSHPTRNSSGKRDLGNASVTATGELGNKILPKFF